MAQTTGGALPNLLIIGAAKSGTTSLHNYLAAHPEVAMSDVKEIDFFSDPEKWSKGLGWYMKHFDETCGVRGESSTAYTRDGNAAQVASKASTTIPDARLIYLVRDPIQRLRSDYAHHRAKGRETRSFADAVTESESPYIEASRYATRLSPFVELFGIERILVETQEQLLNNRRQTLERVFGFIGVDRGLYLPEFDRLWEQSEGKGHLYALAMKVRSTGVRLPKGLRWRAQQLQRSRLFGAETKSADPLALDSGLETVLRERLQPEVDGLRELTGMRFEEWSI